MKPWEAQERERIVTALRDASGFQNVAATALGMTTRQINYKIQKYAIDWRALRPNQPPEARPDLTLGEFAQAIVDEAYRKLEEDR